MASVSSTTNVQNLVINKVPSEEVFETMISNSQVNDNELYFVEGTETEDSTAREMAEAIWNSLGTGVLIYHDPEDASGEYYENVYFTVGALGTGLTYQWQYRTSSSGSWYNSSTTGYNTDTLTIVAVSARNGYQYQCVVTDGSSNTATSGYGTLTFIS